MHSPERQLWRAVLERAVLDARKGRLLERKRAKLWLKLGGPSFQLVCTLAGCDPDYVQRKVG